MEIIELFKRSSSLFKELKKEYKPQDLFTITKILHEHSENNLNKHYCKK